MLAGVHDTPANLLDQYMKIPEQIKLIKGINPGQTTVILGGTHGDELTGVEVIKKLLNYFAADLSKESVNKSQNVNGNIYIGFGNPAAIALKKRAAGTGRDLNRLFIEKEIRSAPSASDQPDLVRARELAPLLEKTDLLIDIHSTSSDSPPFVCFGKNSPERKRIYRLIPVKYILTDPDSLLAIDESTELGTTDHFVSAHGGTAIAYETGKDNDITRIETIFHTILSLLQNTNSLKKVGRAQIIGNNDQPVYKISHNIIARSEIFTFTPGLNVGWQQVVRDQLIGRYADGTAEHAPIDGMIVFPKAEHKIVKGKNLFYMAVKENEI